MGMLDSSLYFKQLQIATIDTTKGKSSIELDRLKRDVAMIQIAKGRSLLLQGHIPQAMQYFKIVERATSSRDAEIQMLLGVGYCDSGKNRKALDFFSRARKYGFPDKQQILRNEALCYLKLGYSRGRIQRKIAQKSSR